MRRDARVGRRGERERRLWRRVNLEIGEILERTNVSEMKKKKEKVGKQ